MLKRVLAVGAAGALMLGVAACGSDDSSSSGSATTQNGSDAGGGGAAGPSGAVLAKTGDIPEGGGKIFPDQQVVVTQPDPGDFKAFSAICTHQKCLVTSVEPA
jgi:Rieske Fe-S protein